MKSIYISLLLSAILLTTALAQKIPVADSIPPCGTSSDFLERNIDPQLLKQMNAQWQAHQKQSKSKGRLSADDPVLYVPVMFHIAHLGEPVGVGSNLSEGQIQAALATLNNIYRARGEYSQANDTKIEFVLANCSGIDRANASGVTNYTSQGAIYSNRDQQQQVQQLFGPVQEIFLNIYVCHRLTGAGGWASYGGRMFISVQEFSQKDDYASSTLGLAHEMGHSFYLKHTFDGDNSDYGEVRCPVNDNPLLDGDQVADTPPHRRYDLLKTESDTATNFCTGQPFGIGLVENHMAYYTNAKRFTPGQIQRMRFYLQNYLTRWISSDAIPSPNNQITISSVPAQICAGTTVTLNVVNNSGSTNATVLVRKGEDVVHYVDGSLGGGSLSFVFPTMRYNTPTRFFPVDNSPMIEGKDYVIEIVAGCNRKKSDPIKLSNIVSYKLTVDGTDGAGFSVPWMYVCSSSSLTLKTGIRFAGDGRAVPVPDEKLNDFEFQWKKDGTVLSGATNSIYPAISSGTYVYSAKVIGCPAQSLSENFTMYSSNYVNSVETEIPANLSKSQCSGSMIKLTSSYASNTASYTWYKDGVVLPTATARILLATESGTYSVVPSDASCTFSKPSNNGVSLYFGSSIENLIANNTVFNKGDTVFCRSTSLVALNQGDGFKYQWLKNGVEVENANYPEYGPTGTADTDATYSLRIRQNGCTSVSNGIRLYFKDKVEKPRLVGPTTYFEGIKHVISLENSNDWRREWYKDDQLIESNWDNNLVITSPGTYKLKKFGPFQSSSFDCSLESDPFVVSPSSTFQFRIMANDTVRVLCNDGNKNPMLQFDETFFKRFYESIQFPISFSFRWVKDGVDVPLSAYGATNTLIFPDADGVYQLRVNYENGSSISNSLTISSITAHSVKLSSKKSILGACDNNVVKLNFHKISFYNLDLVWKRNGTLIQNQNNFQLTASQSGTYTATYQGNGCSITSEPITVTVGGPPPTATLMRAVRHSQR